MCIYMFLNMYVWLYSRSSDTVLDLKGMAQYNKDLNLACASRRAINRHVTC